jgi:hypothetical protein
LAIGIWTLFGIWKLGFGISDILHINGNESSWIGFPNGDGGEEGWLIDLRYVWGDQEARGSF